MHKMSALLIGLLISIMIAINGILAEKTNLVFTIIIIHVIGLIVLLLTKLLFGKEKFSVKNIPIYLFTSGLIGTALIAINTLTFNKIGISLTITLTLLGQTITSIVIDHFGFFSFKKKKFEIIKLIPIGLIISGIILMVVY